MTLVKHPARFSRELLPVFEKELAGFDRVLDPMGGTGERIHEIRPDVIVNEIEYEWAFSRPAINGDALHLPFADGTFDAGVCSPTYANRFKDHHNANDKCSRCKGTGQEWPGDGTVRGLHPKCRKCNGTGLSPRRSYTHDLRAMTGDRNRNLHPNNSGTMGFDWRYKTLHIQAWVELYRVLAWGAHFVLNVKDSHKGREIVHVVDWHLKACELIGFNLLDTIEVGTPGLRYGANSKAREPKEYVFVFSV